eukprot:GHVT01005349.1.p1 GENE.GHVT01005349.1~~GHVT01005349.1.p1  ORF type:complete len:1036 (+),score=251.74 GHVT01005349.1:436-3543(+)
MCLVIISVKYLFGFFCTWVFVVVGVQVEVRQVLLSRLSSSCESSQAVRLAVGHLVAALARVCMDVWETELFAHLQTLLQSQVMNEKEVAVAVFASLLENDADSLKHLLPDFAKVFAIGLDAGCSERVQSTSLKGISHMAEISDTAGERELLRRLVPVIADVVTKAVEKDQEDTAQTGLELFGEMVTRSSLKASDLPDLVHFSLAVARRTATDVSLRDQALCIVHDIARKHPRVLYGGPLLSATLDVVVAMGAEEEAEENDDESTPHKCAAQTMDVLALDIPNKYIYKTAVERLGPFTTSKNPHERKAALVLLGILSEGCQNMMRMRLKTLTPFVWRSFEDPNPIVVSAAACCFTQFAEFLQPEILSFHQQAMPLLIRTLDSRDPSTITKACQAISSLSEHLAEKELKPYLAPLIPKLVHVLKTHEPLVVRDACLDAIGSTAESAKEHFQPFATEMFELLRQIIEMGATDDAALKLKARAICVVGFVAKAVSSDRFEPYREHFVQLVLKTMMIDRNDIRAHSFLFFASLAESMKENFQRYLPSVMPVVLASINQSLTPPAEKHGDTSNIVADAIADPQSSDEEEDAGSINIHEGYYDEVEDAAICLRAVWSSCGPPMMQYIEKTTECIELLAEHFYEGARQQAAMLVKDLLLAVHQNVRPITPWPNDTWAPQLPVTTLLNPSVQRLWDEKLFPVLFALMKDDEEKETVSDACTSFGALCEGLGPALLGSHLPQLVKMAEQVLARKHPCQQDEDVDMDEDSRTEEEYLFEGLTQLIFGVAKVLGPQFVATYKSLHPKIMKLAAHRESLPYRCIGIGCLAEVFMAMKAGCHAFVPSVLEPLHSGILQDEDTDLRRNSLYCLGILFEVAGSVPVFKAKIVEFLRVMQPVISLHREELNESEESALDNAVSALARLLRHVDLSGLPADELVRMFLGALPVGKDLEEIPNVIRTLLHLLTSPITKPVVETQPQLFIKVLLMETSNPEATIPAEVKLEAETTLGSLCQALRAAGRTNIVEEVHAQLAEAPHAQALLSKLVTG